MFQVDASRFGGCAAKDSGALEKPINATEDDDVDESEANQANNPV